MNADPTPLVQEKEKNVAEEKTGDDVPKRKFSPFSDYKPVAPFPQALTESRKDE